MNQTIPLEDIAFCLDWMYGEKPHKPFVYRDGCYRCNGLNLSHPSRWDTSGERAESAARAFLGLAVEWLADHRPPIYVEPMIHEGKPVYCVVGGGKDPCGPEEANATFLEAVINAVFDVANGEY